MCGAEILERNWAPTPTPLGTSADHLVPSDQLPLALTFHSGRTVITVQTEVQAELQLTGFGHMAERPLDIIAQVAERHFTHIDHHRARFDLGQIENVVDESEKLTSRRIDFPEISAERIEFLIDRLFLQHLGVTDDCVEWRAELVTHVCEKEALRLVCLLRRLLCFRDFFLCATPFRDVFHRKHEQRTVMTRLKLARIEQHDAPAESGKIMLELEVIEHRAFWNDVFEKCAQRGNIPLPVA